MNWFQTMMGQSSSLDAAVVCLKTMADYNRKVHMTAHYAPFIREVARQLHAQKCRMVLLESQMDPRHKLSLLDESIFRKIVDLAVPL